MFGDKNAAEREKNLDWVLGKLEPRTTGYKEKKSQYS